MSEARIARAYPHLSPALARVALLGETLELARTMELATGERAGNQAEVEAAKHAAMGTIVELIAQITERDLEAGLAQDLLSRDDFDEALKAKRTMSLTRNRAAERESEREG